MSALALVGAATLALGLAACGDDEPSAVEQAEAGIADVVTERLGDDAPGDVVADCPDDAAVEPGATLRCEVVVGDDDPVTLELAVGDDGGVDLQHAVIPTAAAEAYLARELATAAEGPVTPDCGDTALLVADVGAELRCDVVRQSDGAARSVVVTVLSNDGTVRYVVEAAASPG